MPACIENMPTTTKVEATFRHCHQLQEGLIDCSQSTVALVNYQEEVVVITVAIDRHGLSRGGTDEHVDVVAIVVWNPAV